MPPGPLCDKLELHHFVQYGSKLDNCFKPPPSYQNLGCISGRIHSCRQIYGPDTKRAKKRCRLYTPLFSDVNAKLLKDHLICSRKVSVFMCKSSVYFSALPLSASAPSLWLLWRRHCVAPMADGMKPKESVRVRSLKQSTLKFLSHICRGAVDLYCINCIVLKNKINTYNYLQKRKKIGSPRRDRLRVFESSGNLNRISSSPACDRLSLQYVLKRKGKKNKKHQAFYEIICIVEITIGKISL